MKKALVCVLLVLSLCTPLIAKASGLQIGVTTVPSGMAMCGDPLFPPDDNPK